jgi:hypothetical protein
MTIQDKPIYNDDFITDINRSNNENGLEINEDLIESNWDKVTDRYVSPSRWQQQANFPASMTWS